MSQKRCDTCHEYRNVTCFGKNRSRKDGLHSTCRECRRKLDKLYWDKNRDRLLQKDREYYLKNKEVISAKVHQYAKQNRSKVRAWAKVGRSKTRLEVYGHYCEGDIRCQHCGETDLAILTMDHVNGGGNAHRKFTGCGTGDRLSRWLKRNNYPEG